MEGFEEAAALLPPSLRSRAMALPARERERAEELRLRAGQAPAVTVDGRERPLPGEGRVTCRDLELTVEIATRSSAHTALDRVRQGYFTVRGGHRIGFCGSVSMSSGAVKNLDRLSSLNIRIAHAVPGCGREVLAALTAGGSFPSTLILAPPGGGKTTLLRDMVRLLSNGEVLPPLRVGLSDERGEVAALWEGVPQFDVGSRTDILEGCPKALGLMALLRGMTPQVLACDEITAPADLTALESCANCGVALLCTAHARTVDDLARRPLYRALLGRAVFRRAVVLDPARRGSFRVEELPCSG